jgi:hypothetical protein
MNTPSQSAITPIRRSGWPGAVRRGAVLALVSLALVGTAQAQSRGGHGGGWGGGYHCGYQGGHHGGHHGGGRGWVWGGVGLGLGLGIASYYNSYPYGYYADPGYVVIEPQPQVIYASPHPVYGAPVPARQVQQPVIYPRTGQTAAQTDADANACSEWAGKQANATTDPSVFQRGTQACMDARGYTVR